MTEEEKNKEAKPIKGGRNLVILGLVAIVIVIISTSVSLYIYRASGDIYLDRSRPGFISDDDISEPIYDSVRHFSSDGDVNAGMYDEYLRELDTIINNLDDSESSFNEAPLSDDSLQITLNDEDEDD